jgi:hypothetical protein
MCALACKKRENRIRLEQLERVENPRTVPYPRQTPARTIYPERMNSFSNHNNNNNNNVPPVYYIPMQQFENSRINQNNEKFLDDLPTYEQAIIASKKTFEHENKK